jgi:hypothetical protein
MDRVDKGVFQTTSLSRKTRFEHRFSRNLNHHNSSVIF